MIVKILQGIIERKKYNNCKFREEEYNGYKTLQLITPVFIINFNHRFHPLITFFFPKFYSMLDKKTRN